MSKDDVDDLEFTQLIARAQRKDAARPGFVHSGAGVPCSLDAAAVEDASQAPGEDLSPSAATRLQDPDPEPLRATAAKGKAPGRQRVCTLPLAAVARMCRTMESLMITASHAVSRRGAKRFWEEEHRSCGPPCWQERHQAEADGDPEEGLQEPGGAGTHHIAHDEDHRVRTTSHVPARNREVQ
ncbi:hypothetical protein QTP86_012639 [Hemibagrus guttatus]|nr:hypothetical protein QTP86_012639 [Hemibagrus guttatus]